MVTEHFKGVLHVLHVGDRVHVVGWLHSGTQVSVLMYAAVYQIQCARYKRSAFVFKRSFVKTKCWFNTPATWCAT